MNISELIQHKSLTQPGTPLIMGILNVTPDSFSDGGRFNLEQAMQAQVRTMVDDGVDIIDVGGESTRPGAQVVGLQEELDRVLPVIEFITAHYQTPVSIDTYKAAVMDAAIKAGAKMVNDVNALQSLGAVDLVAKSGVSVCLMHKQGNFLNMQEAPRYVNVVEEVMQFLQERAKVCLQAGIPAANIVLDPGFGFGKALEHNVALFENLEALIAGDYPVLVGVSRKTMIGQLLDGAPVEDRLIGSVAAAMVATLKGAKVLRVHDVKATVQAMRVAGALI
jgi:dihydropteroate synthase